MKEMLDRGAVAMKDYESAVADYNDAATDVQNSLQPLRIFGITAQEIDQAEKQGTSISTELAVRSPISGVIVQKLISPGMLIQAGQTVCFQISDISTVWVQGHIFDRDLPSVRNRRSGGGDQSILQPQLPSARLPTSVPSSIPTPAPRRSASSRPTPAAC